MDNEYYLYLDAVVEKIKNITNETLIISNYTDDTKKCFINTSLNFKTFTFAGCGSKNLLKYFMNKTKDKYGYNFIVQLLDKNGNRQFMPIIKWDTFWNIYYDIPIEHKHLFEVIVSNKPCKPYLDIEWKIKEINITPNKFISMIQNDIIKIFNERYNITLTRKNILILTAHTDIKISFHIIINKIVNKYTYVYRTNCKNQSNSAWDLYIALIEHNDIYKTLLDSSVYSTDREYRTIYSNKHNDFRPLIPYHKTINRYDNTLPLINKKNSLKYMVTYSEYNKHHYIITPVYEPITHNIIQYINVQPNYILSLAQTIHPTAVITCEPTSEIMGWRFSYSDKTEQCYTGNLHNSNGFYIFKHPERGYYMKCMSSNCPKIYYLEKYNQKRII